MLPAELVVLAPSHTPTLIYRDLFRIRIHEPDRWPDCIAYEVERDDLGNGTALIRYRFMGHARAASLRADRARLDLEGEAA